MSTRKNNLNLTMTKIHEDLPPEPVLAAAATAAVVAAPTNPSTRPGTKVASQEAQIMPQIKGSKPIDAWEALQCIQSTRQSYAHRLTTLPPNTPDPTPPNLTYILTQAHTYLTSPDSPVRPAATTSFTLDTPLRLVQRVTQAFGPNAIYETEYLQLLDLRPRNAIELETVIEDFEMRFGERQGELLGIVREVLGEVPRVTAEERAKGVAEEEERRRLEMVEEGKGRKDKGKGKERA
ncbi:hypothetical protein EJ05DRAFT_541959 [Pseudovirgaria hyperparasitica]|uniref:DNA-directed RNA polymerase III subunit RPC9 n=1 Tax=Pseudovirgaria hyperparasitica TaxID=470096 RepID=A0A6A6VV13_9PEZI|nr:uncharacterized protein EJ05DRAFT_541959 [Pseudovirgaria hyperparasitica]KAF2753460.1 hypothetical protein EJ05DRAFT_541959 [Pseudovirgaria hyperparasitica]